LLPSAFFERALLLPSAFFERERFVVLITCVLKVLVGRVAWPVCPSINRGVLPPPLGEVLGRKIAAEHANLGRLPGLKEMALRRAGQVVAARDRRELRKKIDVCAELREA
jgi:hypothetical protein